jgi:translation elongation factor EF-1alpha
MDTEKHEGCVGFVGSSGVGKSRLLGELLYSIGGMDERTKARMEQVSKQNLGKEEDWGTFFMMRNGDWRRGKSCTPHYMELYTEHSHLMVMDTPGSPQYRRNLLRGIFGVNEVVVVISAVNGKKFVVVFFNFSV